MAKNTFIKKEIDSTTSFLYDRKEIVTAPMWPNNSSELLNIYTSSNQPHHQKIYYRTIFSDSSRTGSTDVDFSIAYGHYAGSGSSTGSYGLITSGSQGLSDPKFPVSESLAIYSQYRSMLYETDKRKYLSDGKFRFYGLTDVYLGAYAVGLDNDYDLDYSQKINIPEVRSFELNKIKSISTYKYNEYSIPNISFYLINEEGKLFYNQNGYNNLVQIGTDEDWETVSFGFSHTLAIKTDGTLWGLGSNFYGELGTGFAGNNYTEFTKIGIQSNWKQVYAGRDFSFAINSNGELYAWGRNLDNGTIGGGILGFGDSLDRYYPQKVGSNTWKKISISMVNYPNYDEIFIHGIDTEGKLWAWGNNALASFSSVPTQLGTDTDWKDISAGYQFSIGIKGDNKELYGWGDTGFNGELLGALTPSPNIPYPSTILFSLKQNLTSGNTFGIPESGWSKVECGPDFTFAINSNGNMYCWGNNADSQLNISSSPYSYRNYIQLSSDLVGWDIFSPGCFKSTGVINIPNKNVNSMVSEDIYVINLNRWNFRDKVDAGSWQLSLRTVYTGSGYQLLYEPAPFTSPPYPNITLIDESVNLQGTGDENPMYNVTSKGGAVYGVYRGNLETGIDESAVDSPYGLFFPENGIIILNGEILTNPETRESITLQTRRTPATSSGAFPYSSNADLMYASIKGAMELDELPFVANTVETKIPTYCFIRINNDEFNHTTNRTYYSKEDSFLVKDKLRNVGYPFTYITTIGLYNDNDDLLAIAKLSRPIKKTPSTELVIKLKLNI